MTKRPNRKAAARQVSEDRYRALFEAAPDAVFLIATDGPDAGRILAANGLAAAMHGYAREELLRLHIGDLDVPEDAELVPARLQQLLAEGSIRFRVRHRRCDGSEFPVEVSARMTIVDGQRCAVTFNRDVTAQEQATASIREQQLRLELAAKASNVGFWDWDLTSNAVYFSPEWKAQIGYEPHEVRHHYEEWEQRVHPDDLPAALRAVQAHLHGQQVHMESEFRLRHKDGTWRWIHARGQTLRDDHGATIRMVGCHIDITARKQAEAERAALTRQLVQLQRTEAIGMLAGGIAHDFNNVLAAITGNLELAMLTTVESTGLHENLVEIRNAADRARALVRQILAFSRSQEPARTSTALAPIVTEVTRFLRATIAKAITIELDLADDLPPVLADGAQIHQILVNLCTNACHAMADGPGILRLRLHTARLDATATARITGLQPGLHVGLSVVDTGTGMDAATLARIFEPFFTTKPARIGTGLGLSVVEGIVRGHGGGIEVASEVGVGSTFTVWLPVATTTVAEEPVVALPLAGADEHILLLDDEPALLRATSRNLERIGYRVTTFARPEQAIAALAGNRGAFDLVLTDYEMPGMPGLAVAQCMRAVQPEVPIVLCSGFLHPDALAALERAGVRHVLNKPFSTAELTATIQQALAHRQARTPRPRPRPRARQNS